MDPNYHVSVMRKQETSRINPATPARRRSPDVRGPAAWPINEIMLNALISRGMADEKIAGLYGVSWEDVRRLREAFRM